MFFVLLYSLWLVASLQQDEKWLLHRLGVGQVLDAEIGPTWYWMEFDKNWGVDAPATLAIKSFSPVIMRLSDMTCPGDHFEIFDFDSKIGETRQSEALPASIFSHCQVKERRGDRGEDDDDDEDGKMITDDGYINSFIDPRNVWSTCKISLPAGNHSITFKAQKMHFRTALISVNFELE